ncbi:MAG: leucine-rich repeat domain-containing protein [Bacteroidales bacterium]|nr:leucine-rich repeat domain-containing protein [Bacteroidales bacterium]
MKKRLLLILSICLLLTNAYCQKSNMVDFDNQLTHEDNYLKDDYLLKQKTYKPTKKAIVQEPKTKEPKVQNFKNEVEIETKLDFSRAQLVLPKTDGASKAGVSTSDSLALVALYNSTNGDQWYNNENWLMGPVESWFGITAAGGSIGSIDLDNNNLIGSIPSEIGSVSTLQILILNGNNLTGSIPSELGNLPLLSYLGLYDTQLSGSIPAELGNATTLTDILLHNNQLTGSIPSEFGNLTGLFQITLYKNELTGSIPTTIGNLTNLQYLNVSNNQISGSIPSEIGNCTSMSSLYLYNNQLSGSIPSEIGSCTSLSALYLYNNQLSGAVPNELNSLTNLQYLYLLNNLLTDLPNLTSTNLKGIYFNKNKFSFGDFENTGLDFSTLNPIVYSPQDKITIPSLTDNGNGTTTLTVTTDGTGNTYQWYNEGVELPGETNSSLILSNSSDEGIFYCTVSNPTYPDLKLTSEDLFFNKTSVNGVTQEEHDVLVSFYNATNGANWTNNTNWLSEEDVDNWNGVTVLGGHVTDIDLHSNNLSGTIIPEIGQLVYLNTIQLYFNYLTGTIPKEVGNLTNLTNLDLDFNQLSGTIPAEIGNLTNLNTLFLDNNLLGGLIPVELGNLTNLTILQLHKNDLTGTIPIVLGSLSKLTHLYLSFNNLTGEIPAELGNISTLYRLVLENNQLIGSVPSTLNNCHSLQYLYASDNQLTDLSVLTTTDIQYLEIENNKFTFGDIESCGLDFSTLLLASYAPQSKIAEPAQVDNGNNTTTLTVTTDGTGNTYQWYSMSGILPSEVTNTLTIDNTVEGFYYCMVSNPTYPELILETEKTAFNMTVNHGVYENEYNALVEFYNSTNGTSWNNNSNWLSEKNVNEWVGITVLDGHINAINLSENNLSGTLPTEIGVFSNLVSLNLDHNAITGEIPSEIGNLNALGELNLWENQLSGTIPIEIGNLTNLTTLDIGFNQLTGSIPTEIGNLTKLISLWLNDLQLSGTIPTSIGNLIELRTIGLFNTQITGNIPAEIGNLVNATYIDMSKNKFSGSIPVELGNLTNATRIYLHMNELSGNIPAELGNLTNLQTLYLYTNKLTGALPIELQNCSKLAYLVANSNQLSGTIPAEIGSISTLQYLSLRNNQFTGTIPTEIGNLSILRYLNLASNNLEGDIPSELANLTNLQSLYLDHNGFTNGIDLTGFSFLETISLNDNKLTFGDLENYNLDFLNPNYAYSPQGQLPEPTQTISGENIILSFTTDGTGNTFQWYKNDEEIVGETTNELTILSTTGGIFYCAVSNPNFSALTLTTKAAFVNSTGSHGITQIEYDALVSFYNSTNGNSWNDNTNWLTGEDVETWKGVTVEGGHVTVLKFVANGLTGTIPSSIGDLTYLEKIDIQENEEGITGTIPTEIGNLTNLAHLRFYKNSLSGNIPSTIGNLTELELLDLRYNDLNGAIPSEIGNLTNLVDLNLYSNNLSGNIPAEIGNLTSMSNLNLAYNSLDGELPNEIGNLVNLDLLYLHNNNLEGGIPSNLENLDALTDLQLHNNNLDNLEDLSTLSKLNNLRLDNNNLTFEDFESTKLDFGSLTTNYSPQQDLFMVDQNRYFSEGKTLILNCNTLVTEDLNCETNLYAVYKDGILVKDWSAYEEYIIASFANSNVGVYSIQVKNPNYPNLILYSDELTMGINNVPSDITLSNLSISEGNTIGETIGTLSTIDDSGDTHTYALIAGDGNNDADNSDFTIEENILKTAVSFNYETKDEYHINIQTEDADGLTYAKAFVILVSDNNEAPTDIDLSENSINENSDIGSIIGQLSSTDVDNGDTFTYTFVSGDGSNDADNTSFTIVGTNLKTAVEIDYETKDEYKIYIQTEDADGLSFEKAFTVNISDVDETTGINDLDALELSIYPNPSNGSFAVEYNSLNYEIKIFDVAGSVIYNQISKSFKHEININNISSGTYFVTIIANGTIRTQKLMIK